MSIWWGSSSTGSQIFCILDLVGSNWFLFFFFFSLQLTPETWKLLSCVHLCKPMDCSLPGSAVHGILEARILEGVIIPFTGGPSQPRDQTRVSCIAGKSFTVWTTRGSPKPGKSWNLGESNWFLFEGRAVVWFWGISLGNTSCHGGCCIWDSFD